MIAGGLNISLCMIVRNEEDYVLRCLQSARPVVSQIVVVDTGSSDRTAGIAAEFGAEVRPFAWCGDFAAARNFSIGFAGGDWVLVLDADEVLAERDLLRFKELTADSAYCVRFMQRHYSSDHRISGFLPVSGEFPELEQGHSGYFETGCVRLFPNRRGIEYRGKVHELVEPSIEEMGQLKIRPTDVRIHHFGHTAAVKARRDKPAFYRPLSEDKARENPQSWQSLYELGLNFSVNRDFGQAAAAFARAIGLNPDQVDAYINYGYVLAQLGRFSQAIDVLEQALKLDPRSAEAACNLGAVYISKADFDTAARVLQKATEINPQHINAGCNLAQCLAYLRSFSAAEAEYLRVLSIAPACVTALTDLAGIYRQTGRDTEAEQRLRQALAADQDAAQARQMLAGLLEENGRAEEAAELTAVSRGLKNTSPFKIE